MTSPAVILDEGQFIKNPESITAQAAHKLRADYRLVLTGTPIENRLMDLWSLMQFAMPGILGDKRNFKKLSNLSQPSLCAGWVANRTKPFLLRRTKAQVLTDLPEKIEEDIICELEEQQQVLYNAELKRAQQILLQLKTQPELKHLRFHFLSSLLKLRQICCHPNLVAKTENLLISAKVDALFEILESLISSGNKVLVFSQFVEMLQMIKETVEIKKWNLCYIDGHTEKRQEEVEKFNSTNDAGVFLISLRAGGFGLNLTAASYVILFDPWWNPAVENQAIDRTHRIGQTQKVIAYRIIAKNTIEEKIRILHNKKKLTADAVLNNETFGESLTLDDFQFLLETNQTKELNYSDNQQPLIGSDMPLKTLKLAEDIR